jgi:hypothetical protein
MALVARYEMPEDDDLDSTDAFAPTAPEWMDDDQLASEPASEAPSSCSREPACVGSVIDAWTAEGPLVHEPTGIRRLDELTGGGPCYGTRWYLAGAPDAGKTALLVQVADEFAQRLIEVGLLAVDEDAGDLVTRFAQRRGYMRVDCEVRDAETLSSIRTALGELSINFYDATWTIESAAADLAARAVKRGGRAFLGIDSVQTVTCDADIAAKLAGRELSDVAGVTARAWAIRASATKHRMIVFATSELGRGAYRSSDPEQQSSTLASAKWSGAIEYSARVLLGLRSVAGETDLVDIEIAKNKHGPRDEHVFLRIDRRSQTLVQVQRDQPPAVTAASRDGTARERAHKDAATVAAVMLDQPGLGARGLRAELRAKTGMGSERVDAGLAVLGAAVIRGTGPNRSVPLTLNETLIPEAVRRVMEATK